MSQLSRSVKPPKRAPFPLAATTHRSNDTRLAKLASPFKTPSRLADGTSPTHCTASSSTSLSVRRTRLGGGIFLSSSNRRKSSGRSEKSQVEKLESRARTLRDAVKLLKNREEDDEVEAVTKQWLAAGREIVGRLFKLMPKPESSSVSGKGADP